MSDVQDEIQSFVEKALGRSVPPDANIFDAGATSLFAIELVIFIEKTFDVELQDEDLDAENFATVDALTSLAERRITLK